MELRPGYKQTEVGVIPENWEVKRVKEFATVKGGKRLPRGVFVTDKATPHPYLRVIDMRPGGIDTSDIKYVPDGVFLEIRNYCISVQDIFISVAGSLGIVGKIPADLDGANLTENANKITDIACDRDFLLYHLMSDRIQGIIESEKTVGAQPKLALGRIESFMVALPPTHTEQHAIAGALADVDELIGALEKLIAKKRDLKQAAMQQLLTGKTRLPGFIEDWSMTIFWNIAKRERFAIVDGPFGSQMKVDEYISSGIPVIEMEHLTNGLITGCIERCITPKKFNDLKRSAVYPGDIIISKTGSLGRLGIIPKTIERGLITSRLAKITLDPERSDRMFAFQFLQKLCNDGYWEIVSQGGTMQILGIGMLGNAPIPEISIPEQTAIASVLSDMDTEIAALEQRRDKTRALKQGMMQELLTGNIRLI